MHILSKDNINDPLVSNHGEIIYELVGLTEAHGGAARHSVAHIDLLPKSASLNHYHLIGEETYVMLHGRAKMIVDGTTYHLLPGQTCLIKPGMVHQIINESEHETLSFIAVCSPPWVPDDTYLDESKS